MLTFKHKLGRAIRVEAGGHVGTLLLTKLSGGYVRVVCDMPAAMRVARLDDPDTWAKFPREPGASSSDAAATAGPSGRKPGPATGRAGRA